MTTLELAGIHVNLSDPGEYSVEVPEQERKEYQDRSDDDEGSFLNDSSYMDSIDEDVVASERRRQWSKQLEGEDGSENIVNDTKFIEETSNFKFLGEGDDQILSDSSDCDDSDEERWVANNTDDDDDTLSHIQ